MRFLHLVVVGTVFVSSLATGCGTAKSSARVDDERLVRLPPVSHNAILDKQRDVNVAEGNLTAMKVAQSEAGRFKAIVAGELDAARARYDAEERSVSLAKDAGDAVMLDDATRALQLGRARLEAAEAKMQYAMRLKSLRDSQVAEASAELDLMKTRLELVKFEELRSNNMANDLDARPFMRAEQLATKRLFDRRERSVNLRAEVEARQQQWLSLRSLYDKAAERTGEIPLDAPAPPEPIRSSGE
jgi:hypothetical protein